MREDGIQVKTKSKPPLMHKLFKITYKRVKLAKFVPSGANTPYEWLQVDLLNPKIISKVKIAPPHLSDQRHVRRFKLDCSLDALTFTRFKGQDMTSAMTFLGQNWEVTFDILPHFCRFVKIFPKTWKSAIALRWDLIACASND